MFPEIVGTKDYRKPEWVSHMEEMQEALKGKDKFQLSSISYVLIRVKGIKTRITSPSKNQIINIQKIFTGNICIIIIWKFSSVYFWKDFVNTNTNSLLDAF